MRRIVLIVAFSIVASLAGFSIPRALAAETYKCWWETVWDKKNLEYVPKVICRINGVLQDDGFINEGSVPVTLFPDVGTDSTGECWYLRSVYDGWVELGRIGTDKILAYDPDKDGLPPFAADARVRQCEGEPTDTAAEIEIVWDLISTFDFEIPEPAFNPDGIGVTGLETYIELDVPATETRTVTSPITGGTIVVTFTVDAVETDWGDGTIDTYTETLYPELAKGYPNGSIWHVYETKAYYDIDVSYVWTVRWSAPGVPVTPIAGVPATTWTDTYRVDEIVSRNSG